MWPLRFEGFILFSKTDLVGNHRLATGFLLIKSVTDFAIVRRNSFRQGRFPMMMKRFANAMLPFLISLLCAVSALTSLEASEPSHSEETGQWNGDNSLDYAARLARASENNASFLLSEIAPRYASIGEFGKALDVAKSIDDESYRGVAIAGIAHILLDDADSQRQKQGAQLLADLPLTETGEKGIKPRFPAYLLDDFAKPFIRLGQYEKILELASIGPDDYAIRTALDAVLEGYKFDSNSPERSRELLDQVMRLSKTIKNGEDGGVIQRIALIYAEAGKYDRAIKIAESLAVPDDDVSDFDRAETLEKTALVLARGGQHDRAIELARRTGDYFGNEAFIELAGILRTAGKVNEASSLLSEARSSVTNSIEEQLEQHDLVGFEVVRLAEIAVRYFELGDKQKALEILKTCASSAKQVRKPVERQSALEAVSFSYARLHSYKEAMKITLSAEDRIKPLSQIGAEMVKTGETEDLSKILAMIQETSLDHREAKAEAFCNIADAYLDAGGKELGIGILLEAYQLARKGPVNEFQPSIMMRIAVKLAEVAEYEKALEVTRENPSRFYRIHWQKSEYSRRSQIIILVLRVAIFWVN